MNERRKEGGAAYGLFNWQQKAMRINEAATLTRLGALRRAHVNPRPSLPAVLELTWISADDGIT